ncbi:MAG: hypothetical protein WA268_15435 [Xanthobacteraceae bacterium]
MSTLKPPIHASHVPALPGWFAVFPDELPNDGGIELIKEPVLAWRIETFEVVDRRGPAERFDGVTPVLAGGSISEASLYALQFGGAYFTGNESFRVRDELIEYFRKQMAGKR